MFGFGKRREARGAVADDERRNYPRLQTSCVIDYKVLDEGATPENLGPVGARALDVVNISGGGVCLALPRQHEKGAMLALNIMLPGFGNSVLALGRVQWVRAVDEEHFETGIEFWWVGWDDRNIQEHIRGFLSETLHEPQAD